MNAKLHLWSLATCVVLLTGVACGQGQSKTLAVVNGESITEEQVQKEAATELERLEQKRKQFLTTFERDKKGAVEDALDETRERQGARVGSEEAEHYRRPARSAGSGEQGHGSDRGSRSQVLRRQQSRDQRIVY